MNILNWFFSKITPEGKNTWLSVRYNRWLYHKLNERNERYKRHPCEKLSFFEVAGAGTIAISDSCNHLTGGAAGFGLSISWSRNGLECGGVLGITEAKKLANFILEKCEEESRSEEKILTDWRDTIRERSAKFKANKNTG